MKRDIFFRYKYEKVVYVYFLIRYFLFYYYLLYMGKFKDVTHSLTPSKRNSIKVQRECERIDQKQKSTKNIQMCTCIILTQKHT